MKDFNWLVNGLTTDSEEMAKPPLLTAHSRTATLLNNKKKKKQALEC